MKSGAESPLIHLDMINQASPFLSHSIYTFHKLLLAKLDAVECNYYHSRNISPHIHHSHSRYPDIDTKPSYTPSTQTPISPPTLARSFPNYSTNNTVSLSIFWFHFHTAVSSFHPQHHHTPTPSSPSIFNPHTTQTTTRTPLNHAHSNDTIVSFKFALFAFHLDPLPGSPAFRSDSIMQGGTSIPRF